MEKSITQELYYHSIFFFDDDDHFYVESSKSRIFECVQFFTLKLKITKNLTIFQISIISFYSTGR